MEEMCTKNKKLQNIYSIMQNNSSKLTLWKDNTYFFFVLYYFCDSAKQVCKCYKSSVLITITVQ